MLGLEDSKKVVIVGIPGVGKTSLVTKIAELIKQKNKTVCVHSYGTVMLEEAKKMGLEVILQKSKGHGSAITLGVEVTKSDNIIIFGPDGNHEPEEIIQLIS